MTYKRGNIGEVCHFYTYNSLARPLVASLDETLSQ